MRMDKAKKGKEREGEGVVPKKGGGRANEGRKYVKQYYFGVDKHLCERVCETAWFVCVNVS